MVMNPLDTAKAGVHELVTPFYHLNLQKDQGDYLGLASGALYTSTTVVVGGVLVKAAIKTTDRARIAAKTKPPRVRDERGSIRLPGGGPLSPNQMNQAIQRGNAPAGLRRVDRGKIPGEQTHIHLNDGSALNMDGTWKHGGTTLTNDQSKWLEANGWVIPR